jgi:hypothetical protein
MKLIVSNEGESAPYEPINDTEESDTKEISIDELGTIPRSSFNEIFAFNILHHKPFDVIDELIQKLTEGGKLSITGIDLFEICKNLVNGTINAQDFSKRLIDSKSNAQLLSDLLKVIEPRTDCTLAFSGLVGDQYMVEVIRNG